MSDDSQSNALGEAFAALTQPQRDTILALCTCPTIGAAAKKAGVTDSSIYRWLKDDPDFSRAMTAYQNALLAQQIRHLESALEQAVGVLCKMMKSAIKEETKLKAAQAVIDTVLRARKLGVQSQLDELRSEQTQMKSDWRELLSATPADVERRLLALQARERGE